MEQDAHSADSTTPSSATDTSRRRALSHQQYLDSLPRPSLAQMRRISEIQVQRERETTIKYQEALEHDAAVTIQKAYRGHRDRRHLIGLTLDPSARWTELVKELRFRTAIAQSKPDLSGSGVASPTSMNGAREHWDKIASIAEYASAGDAGSSHVLASPPTRRKRHRAQSADGASMLMDLRYFLEMIDEQHRYGANLQMYHEDWQQSQTKLNFFQWLDYGEGRHVSLPLCDRAKLDRERIRYLSKEERRDYLVAVDDQGLLRWAKSGELISTSSEEYRDSIHGIVPRASTEPSFDDASTKDRLSERRRLNRKLAAIREHATEKLANVTRIHNDPEQEETRTPIGKGSDMDDFDSDISSDSSSHLEPEDLVLHQGITTDRTPRKRLHVSPATILNQLLRKSVRPGTWIYVADTVGRLYVGIKSSGSFQHASFLSGARISSAGSIMIEQGRLTFLSPLSGHYRPTTRSFKAFVDSLKAQAVDLSRLRVSQAYQILLGMEYYGRTVDGMKRLTRHHRQGSDHKAAAEKARTNKSDETGEKGNGSGTSRDHNLQSDSDDEYAKGLSATSLVERHWQEEHKHGLRRLMNDLNIRRKSDERVHTT